MPLKKIIIFTDGACSGNPGPGGIGIVLLYKEHRKELSRGFRWTTNNRMELLALIVALESLKEPCAVEITSDSKYLLDALGKNWIAKWKLNGWKTSAKEPVRNRDLWERLDQLIVQHHPQFSWVKGHAVSKENIVCDTLAVTAIKAKPLAIDEGYEAQSPYQEPSKNKPLPS